MKQLKPGERCLVEATYFPGDNGLKGKVAIVGDWLYPTGGNNKVLSVSHHLIHARPDLQKINAQGASAGMTFNVMRDEPMEHLLRAMPVLIDGSPEMYAWLTGYWTVVAGQLKSLAENMKDAKKLRLEPCMN